MSPAREFTAVAAAVAGRNVRNSFTNPALLVPPIVTALAFFIAHAGGLSGLADLPSWLVGMDYTTFQYAFAVLLTAALSGVFTGVAIAQDFETGFARRLLIATSYRPAILVGFAASTLVRLLPGAVVITVIGFASGMDFEANVLEALVFVAIVGAVAVVAALWASGVALRIRSVEAVPAMLLPVFLISFLTAVYLPMHLLTGWLERVATFNPVTDVLEPSRSLLVGSTLGLGGAVRNLVLLLVATAIWSLTGLRRAERAG